MKILAILVPIWLLAVCVHFFMEAWIIASRGFENLPECRCWWCPHGLRNLWRDRGGR